VNYPIPLSMRRRLGLMASAAVIAASVALFQLLVFTTFLEWTAKALGFGVLAFFAFAWGRDSGEWATKYQLPKRWALVRAMLPIAGFKLLDGQNWSHPPIPTAVWFTLVIAAFVGVHFPSGRLTLDFDQ
jgi:hypothetical protein